VPQAKRFETVEEYVRALPADVQKILRRIRAIVRLVVPGAEEVISYGIPTFDLNGKHLVHVGAWKTHIALYPVPSGAPALNQEVSRYRTGKGTLRFPVAMPIPYDLVERIVRFRAEELYPGADEPVPMAEG
jgi:uncharacterized protein YdhG (YjbR/CyaY superfamily)